MSNTFVPITTAAVDWHQQLPFSVAFQDVYHSEHGALEQSRYVFVDGNNLLSRWKTASHFTIAETGFGTGLNFLLSWKLWLECAPQSATLHFISCEKNPLEVTDIIKSLANYEPIKQQLIEFIEKYPVLTPGFHQLSFCDDRVKLTLMLGDVADCYEQLLVCGDAKLEKNLRTNFVDAWFLDGFAPDKNQDMWSEKVFKIVAMLSKPETTLATYTVASNVKSLLTQYGFQVLKKKGYGPKRHMTTASYTNPIDDQISQRQSPWHVSAAQTYQNKSAIIIGAGLAGCFTAHCLAKRGWQVTILEEKSRIATAASSNSQAVLFPKLSAYRSPLTQFMLMAFLYASDLYNNLLKKHAIGELQGAFIIPHNKKEQLAQESLIDWLERYPELGVLLNAAQASEILGFAQEESGLYIPNSGWIDSPALCELLLQTPGIRLQTNTQVNELSRKQNKWCINEFESEVVVLANGHLLTNFQQTKDLPIKAIRGQMTKIPSNSSSESIKIPLCGDGHVLPAKNGFHNLGASCDLGNDKADLYNQDDLANLAKLQKLAPDINWSNQIESQWAGIRASTPDYLPLVGPIPETAKFVELFHQFATNSKRWIPHPGPYYHGLFACAGFGSRGLTTIPLACEWLAATINNELTCLPRALIQALSPARFLKRNISRGLLR